MTWGASLASPDPDGRAGLLSGALLRNAFLSQHCVLLNPHEGKRPSKGGDGEEGGTLAFKIRSFQELSITAGSGGRWVPWGAGKPDMSPESGNIPLCMSPIIQLPYHL